MNEKMQEPTINVGGTIYTPIGMDEVKEMIHSAVETAMRKTTKPKIQKKFIKGIHELAKFLNVSPSKAQEIKNSGVLPFVQNGRIVLFDPIKVLSALESNK